MVYAVYYNWNFVWIAAGEVTFRVSETPTEYHLSAHGTTYKSYDSFFKVRDYYDSYIDKETLLPNVSIRDIEEGPYTLYDKITFDQQNNQAKSFRGKTKEQAELKTYGIDECMHDILSVIYYARNWEFDHMQVGERIPIQVFVDKEIWPLKVKYKGVEKKKKIRGMGKFDTYVFSPQVVSGYYFNEDTEMNVWVSKDNNKIPLQIETPISVGSVKVILKSYNGLRYDLASKY